MYVTVACGAVTALERPSPPMRAGIGAQDEHRTRNLRTRPTAGGTVDPRGGLGTTSGRTGNHWTGNHWTGNHWTGNEAARSPGRRVGHDAVGRDEVGRNEVGRNEVGRQPKLPARGREEYPPGFPGACTARKVRHLLAELAALSRARGLSSAQT